MNIFKRWKLTQQAQTARKLYPLQTSFPLVVDQDDGYYQVIHCTVIGHKTVKEGNKIHLEVRSGNKTQKIWLVLNKGCFFTKKKLANLIRERT